MTVACTRCGASAEGEIITPPIAFTFKHERGCGHGVGPLAVIKGKTPKKVESKKESKKEKKSKKLKDGEVPWEKGDTESTVSITTSTENEITTTTTTEKGT